MRGELVLRFQCRPQSRRVFGQRWANAQLWRDQEPELENPSSGLIVSIGSSILVPRGCARFGQHQKSRPLERSNFLSMRRVIVLYSQPIRFVRVYSEHAQSDGRSVNRGLPVLDLPRGRDSWCWPGGARPLGTKMGFKFNNGFWTCTERK